MTSELTALIHLAAVHRLFMLNSLDFTFGPLLKITSPLDTYFVRSLHARTRTSSESFPSIPSLFL
jgi:hypothetical protein